VVRPRYAPALVAFFGGGGVSVGISIGAPRVGWVALGWGEPIVPWWGPLGVRGVPRWAGWGGPRVVNRVVVKRETVIHVNDIHRYQNTHARNGFVAVDREHFGRRAVAASRIRSAHVEEYAPVRGDLDLRPRREHRVASSRAVRRPPRERHERPVLAARKPRVAAVSKREAPRQEAGSKRPKGRAWSRSGDGERATPQEPPRHRSQRSREASSRKERSTRSPRTRERPAPAVPQTRTRKPKPKHTQLARAEARAPQAPRAMHRADDERRASRGRSAKSARVGSGKRASARSNARDLSGEPESRVSRQRGRQSQPKAEKAPQARRNAKARREDRRQREHGRRG
jgi:hypothetical protein